MTIFHLVRHGVIADTGKRLSGRTPGLHLSDEGEQQAEAAARYLSGSKFGAIYSSPVERCYETAQIISRPHGLDVEKFDNLIEVDYGKWSNRTFTSLKRLKLWGSVQHHPSSVRFPEGESIREVQARAVDGLYALAERHPKQQICCVTHADVIRLVITHFLGVHIDLYQRVVIGPASVSVLSLAPEGPHVLALNVSPARAEGGR